MSSLLQDGVVEEEEAGDVSDTHRAAEAAGTPTRPRSLRGGTILRAISRMCGELLLDRTEAQLGERVTLNWSIRHESDQPPPVPSERDWIGMFSVDDLEPESFLDYRLRGQNLASEGEIQWLLLLELHQESLQVCFCFYSSSNILLAQSPTLLITNTNEATPTESVGPTPQATTQAPISIKVHGLTCSGLRTKTFGVPEPFIKLSVTNGRGRPKLLHHRQTVTTGISDSTCNPSWDTEIFPLIALPTDLLEVEVRDKFAISRPSATHFLGKVRVPLTFLTNQNTMTETYQLQKRLPSDRVSGSVTMTISTSLVDLPVIREPLNSSADNEPSSPRQELSPLVEQPDDQMHQLPERSSDRIRWVRRTLHGDRHRRDSTSHTRRHSSLVVRSNMTVSDAAATATGAHQAVASGGGATGPQSSLHLGLEQFMARSSRNQFMRQNSCPINRRATPSPHPQHLNVETHPLAQVESHSHTESHSHASPPPLAPDSSNTSTPLSPPIIVAGGSLIDSLISEQEESVSDERDNNTDTAAAAGSSLTVPPSLCRVDSVDDSLKEHPGFLFLTRDDFYEFIKSSGSSVFFQDVSLLKLVQSIRSDHSLYSKYSHSSRLVKAINTFALTDYELPDGWEKRVEKGSHKVVYIDHNSQTTTFIDPRLPLPGRRLRLSIDHGVMRSRPVSSTAAPQRSSTNPETTPTPQEVRPNRSDTTPMPIIHNQQSSTERQTITAPQTYSAKIVNFLRQADIFNILLSRYEGELSQELRTSIEEIRTEGVAKLERLQNEADEVYLELTIILSLFEEDITHQWFSQRQQLMIRPEQVVSRSSLPPPSLTPPPPPSHAPATPPDMDLNRTDYNGIPLVEIIDFFNDDSVYHKVLARFRSIEPYMRVLIHQIRSSISFELAELLSTDAQARHFIFELREDIRGEEAQEPTVPENNEDMELANDDLPTAEQVRAFMAQPDILRQLIPLDPDERSIVQVCGGWDLSLIEFELHRNSVLRYLVTRIAREIREFSVASPVVAEPTPPVDPHVTTPPPINEEFIRKLQQLQSILDVNCYATYGEKKLSIRRDNLLEGAYRFMMTNSAKSLRMKRCNVSWNDEEGLDYGGPQREFFFKLSRMLFNPFYGLFEYTAHGAYTVQISRHSSNIDDAHLWFRFAGRLIGYAIIQNQLLDVFFARHVYKSLLDIPFTISDVETLDLSFYNSLKYVLENDPSPLELTFTVPEESFGEIIDRELKPGGAEIEVTEDNKKEYVDLMINWRLTHMVQQQMECLVNGLKEMIPLEYLKPFDARELEWVIAGTPEINMEDWKGNTQYWGGYHEQHNVIEWFWGSLESFTDEQKLRFLQFATGTSSIPYEGFKALRGSSQQLQKFTIDRHTGPVDSLIIAHTCFNRIDLPPYRSLEEMKQKLLFAILETDTFETA